MLDSKIKKKKMNSEILDDGFENKALKDLHFTFICMNPSQMKQETKRIDDKRNIFE